MQENIVRKIESIMYALNGEGEQGPLKMALYGVSKIYGGAQVIRRECYRRGWRRSFRLPCKVVSVGNLAVGGTGKTPMTAYLARAFERMGQRVAVISRGYKGRGGRNSRVVSDGHQILMATPHSGDEAQLLAQQLKPIPVLIGKDRYRAGMDAVWRLQPDVIILDDGFQHLRLKRDLDLVLLDANAPFGNGHLLPRGILREPESALSAADGVVFTRAVPDQSDNVDHIDFLHPEMAVFRSTHKPYHFIHKRGRSATQGNKIYPDVSHDLSRLENASVAAFSGIARNDDFQRMLRDNGAKIVSSSTFADHHPYSDLELDRIAAQAAAADLLVTTEKDYMRLPPAFEWPLDLMVVGVDIDFGGQEAAFLEFLHSHFDL